MIQKFSVARDRERLVESIIESFSQADLMKMMNEIVNKIMKDVMKDQIFSQTQREEVSTQRNSSQFEMTENVVSSRKQASVRDRVVTRERRRERQRERNREQRRERNRDRGREDKDDISAATEDVNEFIQ